MVQKDKKVNCPLDANEHPDLAARCNRGEWIPSKGEIDSFRLMDDYIDDAIQTQFADEAGGYEIVHETRTLA